MKFRFIIIRIALISIVCSVLFISGLYNQFFSKKLLLNNYELFIHNNDSYQDVINELDTVLFSTNSMQTTNRLLLEWFANKKRLNYWFKPGKYILNSSNSINDIINKVRSRVQDPVTITFNSMDNIDDLFSIVSSVLALDSLDLVDYLHKNQTSKDSLYLKFIPNTYEFFWNASPEDFFNRMNLEYDNFWTLNMLDAADSQQLSKEQVFVLASIVDKEASHVDEMATIAGLYLNRLKQNWRLSADPTIIYIWKKDYNKKIRRIRNKHINKTKKSPFNTYHNIGLPPFPICIPSVQAIESVLFPSSHDYMFMCARPDSSEYHNFAITHSEHQKNAKAFHHWLNQRKIY